MFYTIGVGRILVSGTFQVTKMIFSEIMNYEIFEQNIRTCIFFPRQERHKVRTAMHYFYAPYLSASNQNICSFGYQFY